MKTIMRSAGQALPILVALVFTLGIGLSTAFSEVRGSKVVRRTLGIMNALFSGTPEGIAEFTAAFPKGYTHISNGLDRTDPDGGVFNGLDESFFEVLDLTEIEFTHAMSKGREVSFGWIGHTFFGEDALSRGFEDREYVWFEQWHVVWNKKLTEIISLNEVEGSYPTQDRRIIGLVLFEPFNEELCFNPMGENTGLEGCDADGL